MARPPFAHFLLIAGVVSLMTGCDNEAPKHDLARDERLLKWQLTLARSEGIPTTVEEFLKLTPPFPEDQNAAPFYKKLQTVRPQLRELSSQKTISEKEIEEAKQTVESSRELFEILDAATARRHCRFDRDWKMGMAVMYPELSDIRFGVTALGLRASVAAYSGRHDLAIQDIEKMKTVAQHLGEEPFEIQGIVQSVLQSITLAKIRDLSYAFRDEPSYRSLLTKEVSQLPAVPIALSKRKHLYELVNILVSIEHFKDPEFYKQAGLIEDQLPPNQEVFLKVMSEPESKVKLVAGFRKLWAAFGALEANPSMSRAEFAKLVEPAEFEMTQGFLRHLAIYKLYTAFQDGSKVEELDLFRRQQNEWKALARGLGEPQIAEKIKIDDLISPFDGKPIRYSYDGKRILIDQGEKDGFDNPIIFEFPRPQK